MAVHYHGPENLSITDFLRQGEPRTLENDTFFAAAVAEHNREWQRYGFAHYVYCIFLGILSSAGTIGNILIIVSLVLTHELKKIQPIFIVNLSITDLVITAFVEPISTIGAVRGPVFWRGKSRLCDFVGMVCATSCTASVWCIMAIAFERYCSICHVGVYRKIYSPRKCVAMALVMWVVSYLIFLPNFVGWGVTNYTRDFYICTADLRVWSYSTFWAATSVIVPISTCFYCYVRIYLRIRSSQSGRRLLVGRKKESIVERKESIINAKTVPVVEWTEEIKIIKALFRIFVIFIVSWFPLAVLFSFRSVFRAPKWINLSALLLAHGNSATNAMVYFFMTNHAKASYSAVRALARKWCPNSAAGLLDEKSLAVAFHRTVHPRTPSPQILSRGKTGRRNTVQTAALTTTVKSPFKIVKVVYADPYVAPLSRKVDG